MKILFVGHCTFRITLNSGTTLLTDPWFSHSWFWRAVPPAFQPEQLGKIALILSSHNHLDHIDRISLEAAKKWNSTIVGPPAIFRRARRNRIVNAHALIRDEKISVCGIEIIGAPASHPLAKDAIGFFIRAEGRSIYFSGDTRLTEELKKWLQSHAPVNIAFLSIACARYFGREDGLSMQTAAELAKSFLPETVIPMHYHAKYKLASDPGGLQGLIADPRVRVQVIKLGEEVEI